MAKSRSTIRSELRSKLRIDPSGRVWGDDQLNGYIHEGEIEVARRMKLSPVETSSTFTTTIGDRTYDLSTVAPNHLQIVNVIYDYETVVKYTASTIAFTGSTITDSANGFVTAGFTAGMKLQLVGSSSNDGTDHLTVTNVAAGVLTLSESVSNESAGSSITIVGRTDPDHTKELERVEDIRSIQPFSTTLGYPTKYAVYNNELVFDALPKEADTVEVTFLSLPTEMSTDGTNSDIPDELIPLVRLWAEYLAWDSIPGGEEANKSQNALQNFEREIRRKITLFNFDDYQLRQYKSANWRARNSYT